MLNFQILGPLVVQVESRPVSLGRQQRVLLLALLLARGRAVAASRLTDYLWGGAPSAASAATLRSHVYHLRRTLAGRLEPRRSHDILTAERIGAGNGYALRVPDETVDAWNFRRLLRQGRTALDNGHLIEANSLLREALDMWRGEALADVADLTFAINEARQLLQLHRAARLAKAEAEIRLGLHNEVIGELEAMLSSWPDDDTLRQLLVICLHRSGRVSDAAWVCREGIELKLSRGLDISGFRKLQARILASAPTLPTFSPARDRNIAQPPFGW